MGYRMMDHTADLGLVIDGTDLSDLFTNAAYALFEQLCEKNVPQTVVERTVAISGEDLPDVMINWMRELLYFWNGEQLLLHEVAVNAVTDCQVQAVVGLYPFDPSQHRILAEIKAVTYHQVRVGKVPQGWKARVILDV